MLRSIWLRSTPTRLSNSCGLKCSWACRIRRVSLNTCSRRLASKRETVEQVAERFPMIAKLIVYGRTREGCIMRLRRALEEMVISGVKTSIPLHQALLNEPDILSGDYSIKWLEEWLAERSA